MWSVHHQPSIPLQLLYQPINLLFQSSNPTRHALLPSANLRVNYALQTRNRPRRFGPLVCEVGVVGALREAQHVNVFGEAHFRMLADKEVGEERLQLVDQIGTDQLGPFVFVLYE